MRAVLNVLGTEGYHLEGREATQTTGGTSWTRNVEMTISFDSENEHHDLLPAIFRVCASTQTGGGDELLINMHIHLDSTLRSRICLTYLNGWTTTLEEE